MTRRRLLLVEWDDTAGYHGWRDRRAARKNCDTCLCKSVGWVERDDKGGLMLSQSSSDSDDCDHVLVIPQGCIRKRRRLRHQ